MEKQIIRSKVKQEEFTSSVSPVTVNLNGLLNLMCRVLNSSIYLYVWKNNLSKYLPSTKQN